MKRRAWVLAIVVPCVAVGSSAIAPATAEPRAQDRMPAGSQPRPATNPLAGNAQAISNGAAMFRNRCAGCHGPDARGYLGPDLTGSAAAGGADDRMFQIVRRGVEGTEMPPADPQRVPDRDIWQMLAYVRTLGAVPAAPPTGDAETG